MEKLEHLTNKKLDKLIVLKARRKGSNLMLLQKEKLYRCLGFSNKWLHNLLNKQEVKLISNL